MAVTKDRGDARVGIQSVEVGAHILNTMADLAVPSPLKHVAEKAGMHSAKVHRYLNSLVRCGLAAQDVETGHYGLGPLCIRIGLVAMRDIPPLKLAMRRLTLLRDATKETAVLAVWSGEGAVVVAIEEALGAVTMNVRIGTQLPVTVSAVGLVFAAWLAPELVRPIIKRENRRHTGPKRTDKISVAALTKDARENGFACASEMIFPGITAYAAPVFDHRGSVVCAAGILGPSQRIARDSPEAPIEALKAWTKEVSTLVGFETPP